MTTYINTILQINEINVNRNISAKIGPSRKATYA